MEKVTVAGSSTLTTVTSTGTTIPTITTSARSVGIMIPEYMKFKNIMDSYIHCRSNKRNKHTSLKYEFDFERDLLNLQNKLLNGSYHPSVSLCFVSNKPKKREIFASTFEDRIVHHIIVREMEKVFEPKFIYDSYSCRKGKGTHKAIQRLKKFLYKSSMIDKKSSFFLHLDIKNFFPSIDRFILYELIKKKIYDKFLLNIIEQNIFHDCTKNYRFVGKNISELNNIPHQKSLFGKDNKKGIPIGNLTSQFYANVYLDKVDQFIKHELKCRYYVRYCDDMIILSDSKEKLKCILNKIIEFLKEDLVLELNRRVSKILPVNNGIDFLGYIIRRDYILIRRRVINNLTERIVAFKGSALDHTGTGIIYKYETEAIEKMLAVLNSYLGHFSHGDSFNLTRSIFKKFGFLNEFFVLKNSKVEFKYKIKEFKYFKEQVLYFKGILKNGVMLFQKGNFFRIFSNISFNCNLKYMKKLLTEFGYKDCFEIKNGELKNIIRFFIEKKINFYIVEEILWPAMGPMKRSISTVYKINKKIINGVKNV